MARFKAPAPAPPTPARRQAIKKDLSLVVRFDDLVRNEAVLLPGGEPEFLKFVKGAIEWRKKWHYAEMERQRLNVIVTEKENELAGKDHQIKQARKFVEQEQKARAKAEAERDNLQKQLQGVKDLLLADGGKTINNETLERIRRIDLSGFGSGRPAPHQSHMNPVMEESVESILDASDISFEESRDDILGESRLRPGYSQQQRRSSTHKRRSHSMGTSHFGGEKLVTKTTVVVGKDGSAHAESFIETIPVNMDMDELKRQRKRSRQSRELLNEKVDRMYAPSAPPVDVMMATTPSHPVKRTFSNAGSVPSRQHTFQKKTVVVVERCSPCGKRIKFGKSVLKCRDCAAVCHIECKHDVPMPCVANAARTPNTKINSCYLADFTPLEAPMIPALLDYCVKEVEHRGLSEVGLYRVPGNETEATELLEKFLQGRGPPPRLAKYEIHTITSCIKKFLRQLKEPVIPLSLWHDFVNAANNPDSTFAETDLYQAISELPRPNRDTLAYLAVHLQAVASNSAVNKMDVDNLSMVMGPTIVGFSSTDPMSVMSESGKLKSVMRALLSISADYWSTFLTNDQDTLFGYLNGPSQQQQQKRYFKPMTVASPVETSVAPPPMTGGPARRTRSKQYSSKPFSKKQALFQSPMLN